MNLNGLFILAALFIAQQSISQKIDPAHPDLSPGNFKLDSLPTSEINIPVQVNLKPFFAMAEKSVDTLFTSPGYPDAWIQEGCDTRYKYIFRRSPLSLKGSGTSVNLGFTGYYKIIGSTRLCVNGTVISPWTPACRCGFNEPERRVNVAFTNSLSIEPDFKIKLRFRREEPAALDKCEVCFWGQDITSQVIKGLTTELDAAKKELDKTYGTVDLKPRFQQLWDQLNKSYSLYGLGWLQINPQKVKLNNVFIRSDSLHVFLGLTAKPLVRFEQPEEKGSWIPNLGAFSRHPGFSVFLDAQLNYDSLSRIVNMQLEGKKFEFKKGFIKKKFIIEDCRIYGGGFEKLIVRVTFSGTNTGVVYLVGKPVYDPIGKMIFIADIDFDIKSKNVLLGSADWLFDKKITREIGKFARFELGAYIDTAMNSMEQQLNKEWVPGIRSEGKINNISLTGIYPMQDRLVIRSNCTGHLSVKVESIDFSL